MSRSCTSAAEVGGCSFFVFTNSAQGRAEFHSVDTCVLADSVCGAMLADDSADERVESAERLVSDLSRAGAP